MPEINDSNRHLFDEYTLAEKQRLYESAAEFFSENKRQLFDRLVKNRTRHICVVLEDIFQSHNASAVLRSCDCFGVQDVHVVENHNRYAPNSDVSMGSDKWVDYYKHSDIRQTYDYLRSKGYRIVATLPHENDVMITDMDISQPTALVFGTELTGLTQEAIDLADGYVKVPMYGFTESFNISVCAALSLFYLTEKMRADNRIAWQLDEEEQITLKLYWSMQVIHDGRRVMEHLMQMTKS
ncbi:MAG: RNA methyltransferase [Bacteroidales bacterium]|nr:RNA methyltransferase [Bacteroidales bacterium]MBR3411972.1 RNA methyltransferase [Bacteroidales bacterium]